VRKLVSTPTAISRRLVNALTYAGRTERTVLPEEPETLDAQLLQEEAEAKAEAEKTRPGLTMFAGGSRLDGRASDYAVVWKNSQSWVGIKTNMEFNQEAYDAECATPCKGTGIGIAKADGPGAGHKLHGRPSRHQTDGLGVAWPRPEVRAGRKANRSATDSPAGYHRDPVVPSTQGSPRE